MLTACNGSKLDNRPDGLSYTFTPSVQGTEHRLDVNVQFTGDIDGETSLRVGSRWGRDPKAGARFQNLEIIGKGAVIPDEITQSMILIRHAPGADLTVTYALSSDDMDNASESIEYFYVPVLQSDVIHLMGTSGLVVPHWDKSDVTYDVSINWLNIPEDWSTVDTLPARPLRPRELGSQIFAAAPSYSISKSGERYELTVLKAGQHDFSSEEFTMKMIGIYEGLNMLWDADEPEYLVTLLGTPENSVHSSFTGTGRFNSFASAASPTIDLDFLSQFFAHEVAHHWVPGQLGQWPICQEGEVCPPRVTWFSEGFTDFVMTRAMIADGQWSENDVIDFTNDYLRQYYLSPARNAKAHDIDELFWTDFEHEKQPYWRGFILAMSWDTEIRKHSDNTSSAMDVLNDMYDSAKAAPDGGRPVLTSEYIAQNFGTKMKRDAMKDIEKHYHEGEIISPHPDMFPGCATLKTTPIYPYDVGFDVADTLGTGIVSGVSNNHNASLAGLKNGQIFVAKISGGGGDMTLPIVLNVKDGETLRSISYLPISGESVNVPQFEKHEGCAQAPH